MESYEPTNYCAVDGQKLAVCERGAGEAVVLLHGIPTYSFIWRAVVPPLADRRRLLAMDLLGCGNSDKSLDHSYALSDHAFRLLRAVDALGLSRFHLVGHDLGAGIAQIFGVRHPERVQSLCLINPVGYDLWPVQPITAMRTPVLRQFATATLELGAFRTLVRRGLYHKDRATPELMDLYLKPLRDSHGRKALLHFARCLDIRDLTTIAASLPALDVPVLILRGDADVYLAPEISERLHRDLQDSTLVRIPTAGHFIHEDEPARVASELGGFWDAMNG